MGNTVAPRRCRANRNAFSRAETPTGSPPPATLNQLRRLADRSRSPFSFAVVGAYDHPSLSAGRANPHGRG